MLRRLLTRFPRAVLILLLLPLLGAVICVWWIHGQQRWSLRLAGLVTGLAVITAVLLAAGHRHAPGIWNILLGTVGFVVTLALLLRWWRWRGIRLTDAETAATGGGRPKGSRWQMPLIDILLFTASVAALLGVTRFAVPFPLEAIQVVYVAVFGLVLAVTTLVAIWAVLGRRQWFVRLILLCFVAAVGGAVAGSLPAFLYRRYAFDWWPVMVCGFAALAVLLSFSIFRLHGYQLARGPR